MPALDTLPRKIGRYRLTEKIGEGGMGVVYLGTDPDGRQVAVKVLGPAVASDPNARRRLAREVDTMRRVRNRFVAEVVDADVAGSAPCIVTRFVPGQTLEEVVRANGPLRGAALDALAEGLAEALAAIHAAGVVHRDLKPGNVMLSGGYPVVIDFGIAHVPDSTRLTKTGLVMGTPGYLAPEVIEGGPASGASDVHSWGATVAYAATGRQPFGTGNYQTIFFRVLEGKPEIGGVPRAAAAAGDGGAVDRPAEPPVRPAAGRPARPAPGRPDVGGPARRHPRRLPVHPGAAAVLHPAGAGRVTRSPGVRRPALRRTAVRAVPLTRPGRPGRGRPAAAGRPAGRHVAAAAGRAGRRPAPGRLAAVGAGPAQPGVRRRRGRPQRAAPGRRDDHRAGGAHPAPRGRPGPGRPARAPQRCAGGARATWSS